MATSNSGSTPAVVAFMVEGQRYALPLGAVERVLPMLAIVPLPEAPPVALGVFSLHGTVVPVLDLRRRLALPVRDYPLHAHLMVARSRRRIVALPVDEVNGVVEVPADAVTRPEAVLPGIGHVAGIVTLDDGLLFIQDLDAFLSLDEERSLAQALAEATTSSNPDASQPDSGFGGPVPPGRDEVGA
jgi:purine-binding chemotaxis protein CheW